MRQNPLARARQLRRVLARGGPGEARRRVVRRLASRLADGGGRMRLHPEDVADSSAIEVPVPPDVVRDRPLRIGWITSPPAGGSGGHTTAFRMVQGLERAGHTCSLHLYDVFDGDVAEHTKVIRQHWPGLRADVRDVRDGLPALDAWVATSWETAHVLARRRGAGGHRFYFIQDFEPYFYAHGSEYLLAEDSYRFGFHGITAGGWLADVVRERFGMQADAFEFGADLDVYRLDQGATRDGVVFYAKRDVPRRAFDLGVLALAEFARARPDAPIHVFGDPVGRLPFRAMSHGRVTPAELNTLYNTCRAGLSLSMTNVSLIPWELLASGCLPVVNDAPHNRRVLVNDQVRWAAGSPSAMAAALVQAHDDAASPGIAEAAARSVASASWDEAAAVVTACIERVAASPDLI